MTNTSAVKLQSKKINLTDELTGLIQIIIRETPIFSHIDMSRVLVCASSNRNNGRGGIYGKLVPLKFKNGEAIQKYRGRYYTIPRIINNGIEQMYLVYFYIPKFFDLTPFEKLRVIFHELYHIGEDFNGDIRRMGELKKAHGFSAKRFNTLFERDLHCFHDYIQNTAHHDFLTMDTSILKKDFSRVYCRRLKIPRPVIIEED